MVTVRTVLADGGQMTLSVWLLDRHMNPIASYLDPGDYIELSDSSSNLAFTPDYDVSLSEQFPMSFDARALRVRDCTTPPASRGSAWWKPFRRR